MWLYGIAANLVRNYWRTEQHLLALDARLVPETDVSDGGTEAADRRVVAALLAQLTADQREVLLLYAWAELSLEEIAAALEIAPGTVRSRLSRARAALRAELGDFDFGLWTFGGSSAEWPIREGRDHA